MVKRKTQQTTKKKKKVKQRERKSDMFIAQLSNVTKRPNQASVMLDKRVNNMLSSCRARDKKYGKDTNITTGMIRELVKDIIGKPCPYCGIIIDHKNISLDHIVPLSRGGYSVIENISLICQTCNKQKDKLYHLEFKQLKELIDTFSDESKRYINQKLSMQGGINGFYKRETKTETA